MMGALFRALVMIVAATALVEAAVAQGSARLPRIGILEWSAAPSQRTDALVEWLGRLGYRDGQTAQIIVHYAEGKTETAHRLAQELAAAKLDVIVSVTTPAGHAARAATSTIPIVALAADLVSAGLLNNMTRPEANLTGVSNLMTDIEPKRVEILRELLPGLRIVGYLGSSRDPLARVFIAEAEKAATANGLRLRPVYVGGRDEIAGAIAAMRREGVEAVILQPLFTLTIAEAAEVVKAVDDHRMPAIASLAHFPRSGGLISYGPEMDFNARTAAQYVDQIVKGAKVAELPVQQPTTFFLSINRQAARKLGISVPPSIQIRADEVIE